MIKSVLAAAALAVTMGSASAVTYKDFKVQEGSVPGASSHLFTADKLNGGYTEYLTPTSGSTFSAQAYGNFGQFFKNDGTALAPSQLNGFGDGGYGMYALFSATGTFSGSTFTGVTGEFHLFIDAENDTTFSTSDGITPISTGNNSDDYEIAYSVMLDNGTGDIVGPPGAFNMFYNNFTLTAAGKAYFVEPNPFYLYTQVNGDIDGFTAGVPRVITGDVSAVFVDKVPEPGTIALVGAALLGLGAVRRRKQ